MMVELDEWELNWRREVTALVPTDIAGPWKSHGRWALAGGIAAGWTKLSTLVLISTHGYSITAPDTGMKVVAEGGGFGVINPLFRENKLRFYVPEFDEEISIFGRQAGDGIHRTEDRWNLKVVHPNWPRAKVILSLTTARGDLLEEYALETEYSVEWIRCGFSPDGRSIVIIESSEYSIFHR